MASQDPRVANPIVANSVFVKYRSGGVAAAAAGSARVIPLSTGGAAAAMPLLPNEQPQDAVKRYSKAAGAFHVGFRSGPALDRQLQLRAVL